MSVEDALKLLGVRSVRGSPDELLILAERVNYLVESRGVEWVKTNRKTLMSEWEAYLDRTAP